MYHELMDLLISQWDDLREWTFLEFSIGVLKFDFIVLPFGNP